MHSLLLRVMAERSVTAFNREYSFPHLQVFADRNRVEKEETFEIPSAARDRFLMEILIEAPERFGLAFVSAEASLPSGQALPLTENCSVNNICNDRLGDEQDRPVQGFSLSVHALNESCTTLIYRACTI